MRVAPGEKSLMVENLHAMVYRRIPIRRKKLVLLTCIAVIFGVIFCFNGLDTETDVCGYK